MFPSFWRENSVTYFLFIFPLKKVHKISLFLIIVDITISYNIIMDNQSQKTSPDKIYYKITTDWNQQWLLGGALWVY